MKHCIGCRPGPAVLGVALLLLTACTGEQPAEPGHETHTEAIHEETAHASDEIHLTAEQRGMLDIEVREAVAGRADGRIRAAATVHFDPDRRAVIGPRAPANVVEVLVDLGDRVETGQPLVRMDSTELGRVRAQHLVSAARLSAARERLQRADSLAEQEFASEAEQIEARATFEQARAEHRAATETLRLYGLSLDDIEHHDPPGDEPLSRYTLASPAAGTVQRRDLVRGQHVAPDEAPLHIVDTGQMWLIIEAFEQSLPQLADGDPVWFSTRAVPDHSFRGEIDWISASLDETSRTLQLRARLENPDGLLRDGMAGTATIETGSASQRIALVPVDAVQRIGDRMVVFVPGHEEGAFRAQAVLTGTEGEGLVGIRQGLQPGEPVVVRGAFDLMSTLTAGSRSAAHSH